MGGRKISPSFIWHQQVRIQRKSTMSKCSADETPVCCCMDVGTIMDNSDCTASYSRVFANRAEAEETLAALTEKARGVESETLPNHLDLY